MDEIDFSPPFVGIPTLTKKIEQNNETAYIQFRCVPDRAPGRKGSAE
jgi:hypothetical protein